MCVVLINCVIVNGQYTSTDPQQWIGPGWEEQNLRKYINYFSIVHIYYVLYK